VESCFSGGAGGGAAGAAAGGGGGGLAARGVAGRTAGAGFRPKIEDSDETNVAPPRVDRRWAATA